MLKDNIHNGEMAYEYTFDLERSDKTLDWEWVWSGTWVANEVWGYKSATGYGGEDISLWKSGM